jgi:protein TonB
MRRLFKPYSLFAILFMLFAFTLNVNAQEKKTDDAVYTVVDSEAQFPGGMDALAKFLAENVRYPQLAQEKEVQGRVMISFIVEKNGTLSDIKAVRDIGAGCGDEGVKVVKRMPKWIPAKKNQENVRQQIYLPISFSLQK